MNTALDAALQRAVGAGLLPASAVDEAARLEAERPWPVQLLIGLGAWLVAVPLFGVLALAFGESLLRGATPFVLGALTLLIGTVLLRTDGLPLFVEQLGVPMLPAGGALLAVGWFDPLGARGTEAACLATALLLATLMPRPGLQVLLGAIAAQLGVLALKPEPWLVLWNSAGYWIAVHSMLLAWLLAGTTLAQAKPAIAAVIEAIGCGWLLTLLLDLVWLSGATFMLSRAFDNRLLDELTRLHSWPDSGWAATVPRVVSALMAAAACWHAARAWPALRRWPMAGVATLLIVLAVPLPSLGAVLLALALMATSGRWKRVAAAAIASVWILGSFYYHLDYPLALKALALAALGVLIGLTAWLTWPPGSAAASRPAAVASSVRTDRRTTGLIALGLGATLVIANLGIVQKERLIAYGQPLFLSLRPVDPRSLMQGDFMRLDFSIPYTIIEPPRSGFWLIRPHLVLKRGERGVARMLRSQLSGNTLAPGELSIELTPKKGEWMLVSDAWFFKEGEAERFALARFAEFRVDDDGHALIVRLVDGDLRPLQ